MNASQTHFGRCSLPVQNKVIGSVNLLFKVARRELDHISRERRAQVNMQKYMLLNEVLFKANTFGDESKWCASLTSMSEVGNKRSYSIVESSYYWKRN